MARTDPVGSSDRGVVRGGTAPTFTLRRLVPFGVVVALSALSPAVPHNITPIVKWWLLAWLVVAALAAGCVVARRLPNGHWWHTIVPLLLLPTIQLLRATDGNATSGFSPLVFLPVLWFALYGPLRDVIIASLLAAITLVVPIVAIGAPQYPASGLRGTILLLIVITAAGLAISALVRSSRATNARLAISERRFRAAFDDAPMGMAITGIKGAEAGRFLSVNRAMCALFGRTAQELTSVPVESLTHPDDIAQTRDWFGSATAPDVAHRVEKRYLRPSGRVIWAGVSFTVVRDEAGDPLHLVSQIEDIGDRRRADQALLDALASERAAAEQMRELDASRSVVMSNAAHDLRTPLTSATGFTELLLDGSAGELTEAQKGLVETVSRGLDRLGSIVTELVETSRKQRDQTTQAPHEPFDLGVVLDAAAQAMTIMASLGALTLHVDNRLHGVTVDGDADRMDRALSNLIGNAVKFTPAGGSVRVVGVVDGDLAEVSVADTGIGISADEQDKIFDRYYRATSSTVHGASGTGLGLAIVKEITLQHEGTIDVNSDPGHGTTFTLRVPVRRASADPRVGSNSQEV